MKSMKNGAQFIPLLLLILVLAACSSVEKVEKTDEYQYKEVYHVSKKTGEKEGIYQKYAPDGSLYELAHFSEDQLHGERHLMYGTGKVEIMETYEQGKYHGPARTYYEDGQLKTEGQYVNNVAEGIWKGYYPNGTLREEVHYANNQEEGPFKEWHENGNIKAEGSYKDGDNEHGELKLYDDNGQLLRKMDCVLGACTTVWKSSRATDET